MTSTLQACDERAEISAPKRPALNAFKHGLRARSVLLSRDDAAAFEALRRDLVRMYRPCTPQERKCVHRIAACQWRVDRYTNFGAVFDDKLDDLQMDTTGTVEQHADPDPHHWQHRSIDCGKQEVRFDRLMRQTERRLFLLQQMRRNGLIAAADELLGAEEAPKPELTVAAAERTVERAETVSQESKPEAETHKPAVGLSASPHKPIGYCDERELGVIPARMIPLHAPSPWPPGPSVWAPHAVTQVSSGGG